MPKVTMVPRFVGLIARREKTKASSQPPWMRPSEISQSSLADLAGPGGILVGPLTETALGSPVADHCRIYYGRSPHSHFPGFGTMW